MVQLHKGGADRRMPPKSCTLQEPEERVFGYGCFDQKQPAGAKRASIWLEACGCIGQSSQSFGASLEMIPETAHCVRRLPVLHHRPCRFIPAVFCVTSRHDQGRHRAARHGPGFGGLSAGVPVGFLIFCDLGATGFGTPARVWTIASPQQLHRFHPLSACTSESLPQEGCPTSIVVNDFNSLNLCQCISIRNILCANIPCYIIAYYVHTYACIHVRNTVAHGRTHTHTYIYIYKYIYTHI